MTRRHAVWLISQASLAAGGPGFFSEWTHAAGHQAPPDDGRFQSYRPVFFSADEFKALDAFTTIIIPSDDTPGAREAHAAEFIDFVVGASAEYAPENQQHWREAMAYLKGRHFFDADAARQLAVVEEMSKEGAAGYPHFTLMKTMTVHAFYTSRVGLVDALEYKGLAYLTEFPACRHPDHGAA